MGSDREIIGFVAGVITALVTVPSIFATTLGGVFAVGHVIAFVFGMPGPGIEFWREMLSPPMLRFVLVATGAMAIWLGIKGWRDAPY